MLEHVDLNEITRSLVLEKPSVFLLVCLASVFLQNKAKQSHLGEGGIFTQSPLYNFTPIPFSIGNSLTRGLTPPLKCSNFD